MKKQPRVSVIVTTKNSDSYLEECLKSITNQTYNNIELIVVDNNSIDNTRRIAKKYTRKVYKYGPERSAQRNFGAKKSKSKYILVIDSDMVLTSDVLKACVDKISFNDNIQALVIPEESFGNGFWAQCKKLERTFYVGIDWMEAARFFQTSAFKTLGGYDEKNTGTEDYDLPQRMKQYYGESSISRINKFILHNEQQLSLLKTCKKKYYYAQKLDEYTSEGANIEYYSKQSSPAHRYILFLSHPKLLFKNPLLGIGMLFMKTCEFISGGTGYFISKLGRKEYS